MRLLFDANLSPRLVARLDDLFPQSRHVFDCSDIAKDDLLVWSFAGENGYTIVSKDSDFHALAFLHGSPPKVIRLRIGNGPTDAVEELLRRSVSAIRSFEMDDAAALLDLLP